jgi:hypothetical protein
MEKRNVHLKKKKKTHTHTHTQTNNTIHYNTIQYSAPKNGHLKFCICVKPVIHFLSFHLRKLISPFVSQIPFADLCSFLSLSKKVVAAQGNYLALQLPDSLGPLTLITD